MDAGINNEPLLLCTTPRACTVVVIVRRCFGLDLQITNVVGQPYASIGILCLSERVVSTLSCTPHSDSPSASTDCTRHTEVSRSAVRSNDDTFLPPKSILEVLCLHVYNCLPVYINTPLTFSEYSYAESQRFVFDSITTQTISC